MSASPPASASASATAAPAGDPDHSVGTLVGVFAAAIFGTLVLVAAYLAIVRCCARRPARPKEAAQPPAGGRQEEDARPGFWRRGTAKAAAHKPAAWSPARKQTNAQAVSPRGVVVPGVADAATELYPENEL